MFWNEELFEAVSLCRGAALTMRGTIQCTLFTTSRHVALAMMLASCMVYTTTMDLRSENVNRSEKVSYRKGDFL